MFKTNLHIAFRLGVHQERLSILFLLSLSFQFYTRRNTIKARIWYTQAWLAYFFFHVQYPDV
jgi:hypothetical protein